MNTAFQFSGGRTSAKMLADELEQHGGKLPDDWVVMFENTGKEREETLIFIEEVSQRWAVKINWLEFDDEFDITEYLNDDGEEFRTRKVRSGVFYKIVNFKTASRNGEPFEKLLTMMADFRAVVKNMPPVLPNPVQRLCTAYLKRKVCRSFLLDLGWADWDILMGIRADEAHRRADMLKWLPNNENLLTPLIDRGITKLHVNEFWSHQPFDLQLDQNSDQGNCDLCFLKATGKLIKIIQANPESAKWWMDMETRTGATFSRSKLSYHQLSEMIQNKDPRLEKYIKNPVDKTIDCFCGD